MNFYPLKTKKNTILRRIAGGDSAAFEECIDAYGNLIWALAKRYTATREDAEDAVQEIFTEIWQNAGRYDAEKSAEITFVSMIARRRLIDRLRKIYRQPSVQSIEDTFETQPDVFESEVQTKIQAKRAIAAMQKLNPEQRELMLLNIYGGMSHGEIAQFKQIPLGTVKTHIRRGFQRVRETMVYRKIKKTPVVAA